MLKMKSPSVSDLAVRALPALSGSPLTYNAAKNVFLSMGYTSGAGNTYYKAIRISDRIAVCYDLGQGYSRTFLNGITLAAWDGQKSTVIAKKSWGGYAWRGFNEFSAKQESINMLRDYLKGQAKLMGTDIGDAQLLDFARNMIEATGQKMIA